MRLALLSLLFVLAAGAKRKDWSKVSKVAYLACMTKRYRLSLLRFEIKTGMQWTANGSRETKKMN